jgi:hypothetical protein
VLARARRVGLALPVAFTFGDAFLEEIKQVLDDELGWKGKHRTNGEGPLQDTTTDSIKPPNFR